jgi:hypothetical protein
MGAMSLGDLCQSLEQFTPGGDSLLARDIVGRIHIALARFEELLSREALRETAPQ